MPLYSKKLNARMASPYSVGSFTEEEAKAKAMRLVVGTAGTREEGDFVCLHLLVDEEDGVVADARFTAFGPPSLVGGADALCSLSLRKNYLQASRMTADMLDKEMRDKNGKEAFPQEAHRFLNLVLEAMDAAAETCMDIPIEDAFMPEVDLKGGERQEYPGWEELSDAAKKSVIAHVIAEDIQPYVELDAGGVEVVKVEDNRVTIAYSGNCTTCYSATGATLDAIGNILRHKLFPDLMVQPSQSSLR